jgi:hypothetical protein
LNIRACFEFLISCFEFVFSPELVGGIPSFGRDDLPDFLVGTLSPSDILF